MRRVAIPSCLCAAMLLAWSTPVPQSATGAGGKIEGQVVNAVTGAPLSEASVTLAPVRAGRGEAQAGVAEPAPSLTVQTGDAGQFVFEDVPAGNYTLNGSRIGFWSRKAFQSLKARSGVSLSVGEGQRVTGIVLKLAPCAVITGKVVDEEGRPVQNAQVFPHQYLLVPGYRPRITGGLRRTTDDRGMYRIANLIPGDFVVEATSPLTGRAPDARGMGYARTYYPGSFDPADAERITIESGEVRTLDFVLKKTRVVRVRGKVVDPADGLLTRVEFSLGPKEAGPAMAMEAGIESFNAYDGSFTIDGVPPGSYVMTARTANTRPTRLAVQTLDVSEKMKDVTLTLRPGRQIHGTVRLEGETSRDLTGLTVRLLNTDNAANYPAVGAAGADGAFTIDGVFPVRYAVEVHGFPHGCYVESIRYDGKEIPGGGQIFDKDALLEVTLGTEGAASLIANVTDSNGEPASFASVTLIPTGGPAMAAITGIADAAGVFRFESVRPGEYRLAAWDIDARALFLERQSADYLDPVKSKVKVLTLKPGANEAAEVTSISVEEAERVIFGR